MSIESINAAQQIANTKQKESVKEEEAKTQNLTKGNTKDILATLGVLASIGIATVAIIKSKNAKKELQEALKKAEEEKNKLTEEAKKAADEAKKAAEDLNKKIDEAVNKAKEEFEKRIPKSTRGETPIIEEPAIEATKSEEPVIEAPKATKLSNYLSEKFGNIKKRFNNLFDKKKTVSAEPKEFEPSAEGVNKWLKELHIQDAEAGKQVKEQVKQQLKDNTNTIPIQEFIDSKVPKKHSKKYHNRIQKQYDKMAEKLKEQETSAANEIKPKTVEVPKTETPKVEAKAVEKPIADGAKVVFDEFQGLNDVEKLIVELNGHMDNKYGQNKKRIAEIKAQLEAMGKSDAVLDLTEANSARINIVKNKAERQNWIESLENAKEIKAAYLQDLEAKGLKPLEASDKEIDLQIKYVDYLNSSVKERKNGDIEWAEKYAHNAQMALDQLTEMGKKPIDRTTKEMQLQFDLFKAKNSINQYTQWIKKCDESIQKDISKLKELLQGSEGVTKKNKPISEQKRIADGLKYLDRQEAKAKKAIEESNARNAKWVAEQNAKREAEYEKMYLNAEAEYNARKEAKAVQEGLKYLDEQDAIAKKAIEESNARNAKWVAEQNAMREAEYEKMYLNAEAEYNAKKEAENSIGILKEEAVKDNPIKTTVENNAVNIAGNEIAAEKSQIPEISNQEHLSWLRAHRFIKDKNVLEFPKLYSKTHGKIEIPMNKLTKNQIEFFLSNGYVQSGEVLVLDVSKSLPKNEKALKKLMRELDYEHKIRRLDEASTRIGIRNDAVLYSPIAVPEETTYNYKKYESMYGKNIKDIHFKPDATKEELLQNIDMTREELMQNRERYINEEVARTQIRHRSGHKKQSLWERFKKKIGF